MIYEKKINICGATFIIQENLGIRNLVCIQPGLSLLNTLLPIVEKHETIKTLITEGKNVMHSDFYASTIHHEDPGANIPDVFREPEEPHTLFYTFAISELPGRIVLPQYFLVKVLEILKRVKARSKPMPPPWLFRVNALHSSPCLLEGYDEFEKAMTGKVEHEIKSLALPPKKIAAVLTDKQPGEIYSMLVAELEPAGLLSSQYAEEKIWWLQQFGHSYLANLYAEMQSTLTKASSRDLPIQHQDVLLSSDGAQKLEEQITEIFNHHRSVNDDGILLLNSKITSATRFLYFDLDLYNMLSISDDFRSNTKVSLGLYPHLELILNRISILRQYIQSVNRIQYFPGDDVSLLSDLPFSLVWLPLETLSFTSDPKALALCEYLFQKRVSQPGVFFFKEGIYKITMQAEYDDGIHLRMVAASLLPV